MALVNTAHKQAVKMAAAALRNRHQLAAETIGIQLCGAVEALGYQAGDLGTAESIRYYAQGVQDGGFNGRWARMTPQVRGFAGALVARALEA